MTVFVQLIRLRHWIKNLFVFAPLIFSLRFLDPSSLWRSTLTFVAFCLSSSGVYIFNDIVDRDEDRRHPQKQHRPLAAGRISVALAAVVGVGLVAAAAGLSAMLDPRVALVLAMYLGINVAYSLALKRVVILDVMIVAFGFLLRVSAGGFCIGVPVSNWMLLTTLFLSLFLGFGKRRMDTAPGRAGAALQGRASPGRAASPGGTAPDEDASPGGRALQRYGARVLDYLVVICLTLTIMTYSLYAVGAQTVQKLGTDRLVVTVPLVVFGLFRYLYLVYRKKKGGNPVEVFLGEPVILVAIALWAAAVIAVLLSARGHGLS